MVMTDEARACELVRDFFKKLEDEGHAATEYVWHLLTALRGPDSGDDDEYNAKKLTTVVRRALFSKEIALRIGVIDCGTYRESRLPVSDLVMLDEAQISEYGKDRIPLPDHFINHTYRAFQVLRMVKGYTQFHRDTKGRFAKRHKKV